MLSVTDIDSGVGAGLAIGTAGITEEDQIARLQLTDIVDPGAVPALPLAGGGVRKGVAKLLIDVHGEP